MCKFFSAIVKRDLEVVHAVEIDDSHESIIKKYKLKDDKLINRDFVRLELTPKDNDVFNHKITNWNYEVDEEGTLPKWYKDKEIEITKRAYKVLRQIFKEQFLIDAEIEELLGNVKYVKNSKINILRGKVGEMWDSSQVGSMSDSSQVGKMWGSSQVGSMWGSSQVKQTDGDITINIWSPKAKVIKQGKHTVVIERCWDSKPKVSVK